MQAVETEGVHHLYQKLVGDDQEAEHEDNDKSEDKQDDGQTKAKQMQKDIRDPDNSQEAEAGNEPQQLQANRQ